MKEKKEKKENYQKIDNYQLWTLGQVIEQFCTSSIFSYVIAVRINVRKF